LPGVTDVAADEKDQSVRLTLDLDVATEANIRIFLEEAGFRPQGEE